MEKLLGVTVLGSCGILCPVAIKVSGSCTSWVISLSQSISKMSTVHTVEPCRYISTNPKAIYSKLYWIHFQVLLVQHKSMALGTMQRHTYRTALLGSQNCWWIVQVNYQEPIYTIYLGLIYKTYKVYIRLFFNRIPKLQENTVLGIIWHQISMYLVLWFNLFLYFTGIPPPCFSITFLFK